MTLAQAFVQSGFIRFINSPAGRIVRVLAGLGLVAWGFTLRDSTGGLVLMAFGLLPIATGAFDLCLPGVVVGAPARGNEYRNRRPD
jgi:hypothetical protein